MPTELSEQLENKLRENEQHIKAVFADIDKEIAEKRVPNGRIYFLDVNGKKIAEADIREKFQIADGTAKIIANGDFRYEGGIKQSKENLQIFAKGSVSVTPQGKQDTFADIKATGTVSIGGNHYGKIQTNSGVYIKGRMVGPIYTNNDVKIDIDSHAEIVSGGNVKVGGYTKDKELVGGKVEGNITAGGGVVARKVAKGVTIHARDEAKIHYYNFGTINSDTKVTIEQGHNAGTVNVPPSGISSDLLGIKSPNTGRWLQPN